MPNDTSIIYCLKSLKVWTYYHLQCPGQAGPVKIVKTSKIQNHKWLHKKNIYKVGVNIYQTWKFHEKHQSHHWEITCKKPHKILLKHVATSGPSVNVESKARSSC